MAFDLHDIVPFGRSYREYVDMFALDEADRSGRILDCGGGPAAFNAELTRQGGRVVSADPVYALAPEAIRARIDEVVPEMVVQLRRNRDQFRWDRSGSPEELVALRQAAMEAFLADYPAGLREGRYVAATLPELPFEEDRFDLALVSHLLFLYSDHLDEAFHAGALKELAGLAREVRVFPLADLNARRSRHLEPVRWALDEAGYPSEVVQVEYESQKGVNQMLRIGSGGA